MRTREPIVGVRTVKIPFSIFGNIMSECNFCGSQLEFCTCDSDGIDAYYARQQSASRREYEILRQMIEQGVSQSEINIQEQKAIDAGNTGD